MQIILLLINSFTTKVNHKHGCTPETHLHTHAKCCLFGVLNCLRRSKTYFFTVFSERSDSTTKTSTTIRRTQKQFGTLLFGRADFLFIFSEKTRKTSPKIWSSQSLPNMCIVVLVVFLLPVNFLRIFFREQDWKIYFFTKLKNKQAIFCWLSVLLNGHRRRCRWVPHNALLADSQAR